MWGLGIEALKYEASHPGNPIVDYVSTPSNPIPDTKGETHETQRPLYASSNSDFSALWLWVLGSIAVVAFALYYLRKRGIEATKDPVTSGPAMRNGGLTDENALGYATQVANRQFNNQSLQVREVQRGLLSGTNLEVSYAGQLTPARRTFANQPAYRGVVNVNGADQFVYFLQGCGNDVRKGNYFTGQNIQFIVNAEAPVLRPEMPAIVETTNQQMNSEMLQMVTLMTAVLKEKQSGNMSIKNPNGNEVTMNFSASSILLSTNGDRKNPFTEKVKEEIH